jgi:Zn-dependent peptidase ImmA (M78 family)/transcriptional regulator with XRE-family HTH domain
MTGNSDRIRRVIGERIRMAREAKDWTQDSLADAMGIADRQSISMIESGERKVAADEMVRFIAVLGQPLAYFTDPDLVVEENFFSYRARPDAAGIALFEAGAKQLIETNRRLRTLLGEQPPPTFSGLRGLTKNSPVDTAGMYGYRFYVNWKLGDCPAATLREAIVRDCHVLILEVDAPEGVSGAACHLEDGDVILLNRTEPSYRKNFTLGHEFFHLLTWQDMPPARDDVEESTEKKPKVEQLADAFTSSLLMPTPVLQRVWANSHGSSRDRVMHVARHFDVSGKAAYFRLVNGRYLRDPNRELLKEDLTRNDERKPMPPRFDADFVKRLHSAIENGRMTANRAAELLDMDRDELLSLFTEHHLTDPINS